MEQMPCHPLWRASPSARRSARWGRPGGVLNIYLGEEQVGNLAMLARKPAMACGIKNLAVMLFELDVDALRPFRSRTNRFTHLPEYPMTDYDISLLFDSQVKWSQMHDVIAQGIRKTACSMGQTLWTSTTASRYPPGRSPSPSG